MITSTSLILFVLTLAGAEVALVHAAGISTVSQLSNFDWPIIDMFGVAIAQGLAWLTVSPKEQPLGKETKANVPGN
jgi:hypothetical protein